MAFYLCVFINIILCSAYLFPFGFTVLPAGVNTKIAMAAIGLFFVLRDMKKSLDIPVFLVGVVALGGVFSCIGLFSVYYNETSDYAYATYIISMLVWLSAAYTFVLSVARIHGYVSLRLIVNYLVAVCVLQCMLALVIAYYLPFKHLVDTYILQVAADTDFLNEVDRLYGIGAAVDLAGVRFAAVLVLMSVVLNIDPDLPSGTLVLYVSSFLIIVAVGNLISRTTIVGAALGIAYLISSSGILTFRIRSRGLAIGGVLAIGAVLLFAIGYFLYVNVEDVRELLRYGFEGFFNWVEKGEWTTSSTEKLNTMWVYPDNLKTWVIGDGLFTDPFGKGYYMYTDIGYLRFIFYCGVIGLFLFCLFFIYVVRMVSGLFPAYRIAFFLLLLLGFLVWVKVSTDLFQFYALFLTLATCPVQYKNRKIRML